MGNNAIITNPSTSDLSISSTASSWLWAVFAIMLVTDLVFIAWSFMLPKGRRVFHHLAVILLTTAAISYFSMASNLGSSPVQVEYRNIGQTRALWWVRYIDWVITTPCLLLELLFATGLPLSEIITLVFFDEVMIVTGLVGGLVVSSFKWGYFAFGCAALVYIWWVLLGPALKSSALLGDDFRKAYVFSAIYLSAVWALYPIAWGLADGGNVISPDSEMYFYGVLDVIAKPVFTIYHVFMVSRLDYTKLQLQSGKYSEGASLISQNDAELASMQAQKNKVATHHATPVVGNNGTAPVRA